MTNLELVKVITDLVGGEGNVIKATNCMTRLRLTIKDIELVKTKELKNTEGVLGVVEANNYLRVVLGPDRAKKVTDICISELELPRDGVVTEDWQDNKQAIRDSQERSKFKKIVNVTASIFIPLIPAIIAAGIFNGLGSLVSTLQGQGTFPTEGFQQAIQLVFSLIDGGSLSHSTIYIGINAARRFGITEVLGGMTGAISISGNIVALPTMLDLYDEVVFLNPILTTGKGSIIGVIIGVHIFAKVEGSVRNIVPDVLDLMLTPLLTLFITAVILIFIITPVAGYLSDGLVSALSVIVNSSNPVISVISGFVLATLFSPTVLLGLRRGLTPIYAVQLGVIGGVSLSPVLTMAGVGRVGTAIVIYFMARRIKNARLQKVITGALSAGFLGIREPLICGVTLPIFKPSITAGIRAGFGGAYAMLAHVLVNSWGPSGLVAIPMMEPEGVLDFFIGLVTSYVTEFIITYFAIKGSDAKSA